MQHQGTLDNYSQWAQSKTALQRNFLGMY